MSEQAQSGEEADKEIREWSRGVIQLINEGSLEEAGKLVQDVLERHPTSGIVVHLEGILVMKRGEYLKALGIFRQASALSPKVPEFYYYQGLCHHELKEYGEAKEAFSMALSYNPRYFEALCSLGMTLSVSKFYKEAGNAYRLALKLRPDTAMLHFNLGVVLEGEDRIDDAIGSYVNALQVDPNCIPAYNNLGTALYKTGHADEATKAFERALAIEPSNDFMRSNYLSLLNYCERRNPEEIFAEHKKWGEVHGESLYPKELSFSNSSDPVRRLRIGYVSPDFFRHSVAYFFLPVIRNHDRTKVEVFCYSDVGKEDEVTREIEGLSDHWRNINTDSDEELARKIREDGIDILVELTGHTEKNRLRVLSRKPAPVQVSWLGYPNTTGVETIDYRFSDAFVEPEEMEKYSTEKIVRLPNGFHCYGPNPHSPEVSLLPARKNGYITFGSFNKNSKISPSTIAVWSKVLCAVPNSRILLKSMWFTDPVICQRFYDLFEKHGVNRERVQFCGRTKGTVRHLETFAEVDIALDTFPYNGTTTTCENLWMGVPVIAMFGKIPAARVSGSLLKRIGLEEAVGNSVDEYVAKAVALAKDIDRLEHIRLTMRDRLNKSPLLNGKAFAQDVEKAYLEMWKNWCATQPRNSVPVISTGAATLTQKKTGKLATPTDGEGISETMPAIEKKKVDGKRGRGVIYIYWGSGQEDMLKRSMDSLKAEHPELDVEVIQLPDNSTLLDKAAMYKKTPFEETLFLDTDTIVLGRLDYGFEQAKKIGLACAICECPWARRYGGLSGDMNEYNTGVLFFTPKAKPVFDYWEEHAKTMDSSIVFVTGGENLGRMPYNDQAAFAAGVHAWDRAPFVLPQNWNFRPIWHTNLFGPLKIWHDNKDVPEQLLEWNENQKKADSIVQYTRFMVY